jgi:hypothetical protein
MLRIQSSGHKSLQACLASICELPLTAVPEAPPEDDVHDRLEYNQQFWAIYESWLRERYGLALVHFAAPAPDGPDSVGSWGTGLAIGIIASPRDPDRLHGVILRDGKIVWDPHPDQDGYDKPLKYVGVFVAIDSSQIGPINEPACG